MIKWVNLINWLTNELNKTFVSLKYKQFDSYWHLFKFKLHINVCQNILNFIIHSIYQFTCCFKQLVLICYRNFSVFIQLNFIPSFQLKIWLYNPIQNSQLPLNPISLLTMADYQFKIDRFIEKNRYQTTFYETIQ